MIEDPAAAFSGRPPLALGAAASQARDADAQRCTERLVAKAARTAVHVAFRSMRSRPVGSRTGLRREFAALSILVNTRRVSRGLSIRTRHDRPPHLPITSEIDRCNPASFRRRQRCTCWTGRIKPGASPMDVINDHEYDGGMTVAKVAITVPEETLRAVEKRRRVLGMSRSAVVSAALDSWLADQAMTAEERRYVIAYLKQPETAEEVRETTAIGAAAMGGWDPWIDTSAKRPVAKRPTAKRSAGGPKRSKAKR